MERGDLQVFKLLDLDVGKFTKNTEPFFSKTRHFFNYNKNCYHRRRKKFDKGFGRKIYKKTK